ncbi:major histocompatibility complex class I-related gene protein-like [Chanos chanos]|uniref:Major histocompatibility complex class I-related gene protein-like n=1 Tax=Chanos chanos TaxID=29144 RepID=A0A6J2WLF9_CHACN|nr:major histocompatibility complex class I-related gene protein-like [Chanos chanos]
MMTVMDHSQSDPDVHVLQRRRGCEVERLSDGSVKFLSGSEHYRYDGQDFLSFKLHTEQWEALNDQALSIKQRWNSNIPLKQDTLGYIKETCVDWAEELMKYEDDYIRNYYITMKIGRNRFQVREKLESTGVRPNGGGTHQLRMSVEIPESDRAEFRCFVNHRALETPIVKIWVWESLFHFGVIVGAVIGVLVLISVVVGILIYIKTHKNITAATASNQTANTATLRSSEE